MRVAITGSTGRLGRALMAAFGDAPFTGPSGPVGWDRAAFDLDDAARTADALLDRDRPEVVVHAAAWTDVDGCARDVALARGRNGDATGALARACAERGVDLIAISTNEVFDGARRDGRGYATDYPAGPANAYGASKLEGERQATTAYDAAHATGRLAIVRTAWLFGPGAPDFPHKIMRAGEEALRAGIPLRAVGDEWGTPTYTHDLAEALVWLVGEDAVVAPGERVAIHHIVGGGVASRADWARDVLGRVGVDVTVDEVPGSTWSRASTPPAWAVLAQTPLPGREPLRPWPEAMADYAPSLRRSGTASSSAARA